MQEVFKKIIEKLEERTSFLSDCTKYGNKDAEQQRKSYSTMMMYEVADLVDDLIDIVKHEAEQYEECYKDCGECEAYDKEKHHCPKFCKVITEAVKEIEENHNGWIPCTDRLPTPEEYKRGNGRFLVTDGNRTYEAEFDIYESHTFGKSQMSEDWFVTDKCVTHWQNEPLPPKSYQPDGE